MAWTTPGTAVAGSVATAAFANVNYRDDLAYLKSVVDGTLAGQIPNAAFTDATINPLKLLNYLLVGREFRTGLSVPSGDPGAVADTLSIFTNKSNADHEVVFFNNNTSPSGGALEFAFWQRAYSITAMCLGITNDGKLTGKGFYDSGEVSLAASGSSNLTHGLGAKPRYLGGYWSATSGQVAGTAATTPLAGGFAAPSIYINTVSDTTIAVANTSGVTRYIRVLAML